MKNNKKIQKQIDYWLKASKEDLKIMRLLYKQKVYHYALFFGHLCVEKIIKAYFVKIKKQPPPFKHELSLIASLIDEDLFKNRLNFLKEITIFNIATRYPDQKFSFYKTCTKKFTEKYIKQIEEFYEWLLKKL